MRIVIIGAGNLSFSLAPALSRAGWQIVQVLSRTRESALALAALLGCEAETDPTKIEKDADVYIYCLKDEVYTSSSYSQEIARSVNSSTFHLLTAGSVSWEVLGHTNVGTIYPFQTFSKAEPITDFSDVPILYEGSDDRTEEVIRTIGRSISKRLYKADAASRGRLHLAGGFANNFSNCMYALAAEQMEKAGLPFELLYPIIEQTVSKIHRLRPREAQTGPAVRGDEEVMQKHLALLEDSGEKEIYQSISRNIREFAVNH